MSAMEQFAEAALQNQNSPANVFEPLFAPKDSDEFSQNLKLIQNQNESEGTSKSDDVAQFINMGNDSQGRKFQVAEDKSIKYTVEEGDSLWSIVNEALTKKDGQSPAAWKTLETLRKIAEKNNMNNPDLIHAGDVIDFSVLGENEDTREEQRPPIDTADGAQSPPQIPDSDDTEDRAEPPKDTNQAGASGHSPRENWYISQERDGETGPWFGCAPTSLLMAMADYGLAEPTEANRQKLIRETGTARPLGFPGKSDLMSVEAQKRGLNSESRDTTDWREVDAQVEKGRGVIVNGTMKNGGKHFVYISGKDASGKYIVGDPAEPAKTNWTTEDLRGFMSRLPGPLGYAAVWR